MNLKKRNLHWNRHGVILYIGDYKEEAVVSLGNLKNLGFREL